MEKFIVEISARHIHVTKEQVAILFGRETPTDINYVDLAKAEF